MDDTVYFVNRFGMSCRMGRLKTSSLVNGHIYQYGTLFHQFQHGACNEVGGLCTGDKYRTDYQSVVGSSFSILWLDENNVFTFLGIELA